ncbi:hypothetical protein M434DRAFT_99561 [Hypoxylon sp. CO27-5]|nr:hypothetical protein M434DRAFT_99561 [Hypoxylon sp. CO27-5]
MCTSFWRVGVLYCISLPSRLVSSCLGPQRPGLSVRRGWWYAMGKGLAVFLPFLRETSRGLQLPQNYKMSRRGGRGCIGGFQFSQPFTETVAAEYRVRWRRSAWGRKDGK